MDCPNLRELRRESRKEVGDAFTSVSNLLGGSKQSENGKADTVSRAKMVQTVLNFAEASQWFCRRGQLFIRRAAWESITLLLPLWPSEYKGPRFDSFLIGEVLGHKSTLQLRLFFWERDFWFCTASLVRTFTVLGEEINKNRLDSCNGVGESIFLV